MLIKGSLHFFCSYGISTVRSGLFDLSCILIIDANIVVYREAVDKYVSFQMKYKRTYFPSWSSVVVQCSK